METRPEPIIKIARTFQPRVRAPFHLQRFDDPPTIRFHSLTLQEQKGPQRVTKSHRPHKLIKQEKVWCVIGSPEGLIAEKENIKLCVMRFVERRS